MAADGRLMDTGTASPSIVTERASAHSTCAPLELRVVTESLREAATITDGAKDTEACDATDGHVAERQTGGPDGQPPTAWHVKFAEPTRPRPGPQEKSRDSGATAYKVDDTLPPTGAANAGQIQFRYHTIAPS
eukprot:Amastigsp_a341236_12.p4 type:complete len:133 gc:universal Amastigsp_a341236_12:1330-932(-)